MLRLRHSILSHLLSSSSASPISQLSRLISGAAPAVPPNPRFAVEEYLFSTCGLTRPQAAKASPKLSHLKSPAKPDAVIAFLAGLGLSTADVAALVARDPKFLCAGVERTLSPVVAGLTGLGLSPSEIALLVSVASFSFRRRSIISGLPYFLSLFGSYEKLLRALKRHPSFLGCDLDRVVKPVIVLLQECGLSACDIAKLCLVVPWLLSSNLDRVHGMVGFAEGLGVPRGSGMFRQALQAVAFSDKEKIASKVEFLKKTFRWSEAEVGIAVSKYPGMLNNSNGMLQRKSEFLISEAGLEPGYIAYRPVIVNYSMDGRLRPRYYVFKFLKANGLLDRGRDYYRTAMISEKEFVGKFICPHKEAAPHLADDYATACRGEVPARFIFA